MNEVDQVKYLEARHSQGKSRSQSSRLSPTGFPAYKEDISEIRNRKSSRTAALHCNSDIRIFSAFSSFWVDFVPLLDPLLKPESFHYALSQHHGLESEYRPTL
jgi:hypothetical protein